VHSARHQPSLMPTHNTPRPAVPSPCPCTSSYPCCRQVFIIQGVTGVCVPMMCSGAQPAPVPADPKSAEHVVAGSAPAATVLMAM